jgi:hypothetical protein
VDLDVVKRNRNPSFYAYPEGAKYLGVQAEWLLLQCTAGYRKDGQVKITSPRLVLTRGLELEMGGLDAFVLRSFVLAQDRVLPS